jgi:hypothetical protein
LLGTLLVVAACRQNGEPLSGPSIAIDDAKHDFGVVAAGTELRHGFEIVNRGERPLRLDSLEAGCGCAVRGAEETVPPKGRMLVEITCDTTGLSGRYRRTVTVRANDAVQPVTVLALEAEVRADVAAVPPALYFGVARAGSRTARDLRLVLQDANAAPTRARSELGLLEPALERRSDGSWRVRVSVAPGAPPGVLRDRLLIDTGSRQQAQLVVPVVGTVESEAPS